MNTQFYHCEIEVDEPVVGQVDQTVLILQYQQNRSKYLEREHESIDAVILDDDNFSSGGTPNCDLNINHIINTMTMSDNSKISQNSTPQIISKHMQQTSPDLIVGLKRVFKDCAHYIIDSNGESKKLCLDSLLVKADAENVLNSNEINEYFQKFNSTVTTMAYNMGIRLHGSTDPVMHLKVKLKNMFFFNNNQEKKIQSADTQETNSNISENIINGLDPSPVYFFENLTSSYSEYTKLQSFCDKSAELKDSSLTIPPVYPLILQSSCPEVDNIDPEVSNTFVDDEN